MEEAETLSSRLAIMTKGGQIVCQNTTVKIKNDYGKNFTVELTFKPNDGSSNLFELAGPVQPYWTRQEVIEALEDRHENHLASQVGQKGVLCPQSWHSDGAEIPLADLN